MGSEVLAQIGSANTAPVEPPALDGWETVDPTHSSATDVIKYVHHRSRYINIRMRKLYVILLIPMTPMIPMIPIPGVIKCV